MMSYELALSEIAAYAIAITSTVSFILFLGALSVLIPSGVERQRRREETVDRDLEARRAQFPDGVLESVVESNLTGGRISPKTVQRFIDRGWLDPR